jgi:hypothetical protein
MKRSFFPAILPAFALFLLLGGCARVGDPTGGPKDVTPPRLDSVASTRNFTTRFTERRIELTFDEWITLDNPGTQIAVSPPLAKRPDVTLKGRTVTIELDPAEVLRPNTTYTIDFGSAVKDFHEGNAATDLRFVFSTGDVIDTLRMAGTVVDALTGEPAGEVGVLLYDELNDSLLRRERPYYFTRSDKTGAFRLENLRAGLFHIVAVEDADQNQRWSGEQERLGFVDTLVRTDQPRPPVVTIRMYRETGPLRVSARDANRFGLVRLVFTGPGDTVWLRTPDPEVRLLPERQSDTVLVWYDRPSAGSWQLYAGAEDTVRVRSLSREDFLKTHRLTFGGASLGASAAKSSKTTRAAPTGGGAAADRPILLSPGKETGLLFNSPVTSLDTARWLLQADTQRLSGLRLSRDTLLPRRVRVDFDWQAGRTYRLLLLPGAATDLFGTANVDTLRQNFLLSAEKQLGGLNLSLTSLVPGTSYIVQLFNGKTLETERRFTAAAAEERLVFTNLPAATYALRLIEDRNGNGRWDGGSFARRLQPEPVFNRNLEALRANWEVEAVIDALDQQALKRQKQRG